MTTAIAIFVKTPSLSPIKTRLAADIGAKAALEFYHQAIKTIETVVNTIDNAAPYWAIKEQQGLAHPMWQNWQRIHASGECLGTVQSAVYSQLRQDHERVILLGADCPHMPASYIKEAIEALHSHKTVIGAAKDGGYTLFGGCTDIPLKTWQSVTYSQSDTLEQLEKSLGTKPHRLTEIYTDIDTEADLLATAPAT